MSKNRVTHTILAAAFLLFAAVVVMLGIHSTNTYAADLEIPEDETVLYSEQSVPVPQDITQADYDYMEDTYNIHPDGIPVIESKTEENATVVTKTENGTKTRTKKTTTWVVRDTDPKQTTQPSAEVTAPDISNAPVATPATTPTPTTTPTTTTPTTTTNDSTSLALTVGAVALAAPVVVAALPAIAIAAPAIIAVAVPAVIAGSLLSGNSNSNSSQSSQSTQPGLSGLNLLG